MSLGKHFTLISHEAQAVDPLWLSNLTKYLSAAETVDLGSIPGRVKPKTIKNGIYSFPA